MKSKIIKIILIVFGVIVLDQVSKFIIMSTLERGESLVIIRNFFSLLYSLNTGAAFGLFSGYTILLVLISLGVLVYLISQMKTYMNNSKVLCCFGLLLGGLIGNLIDRVVLGYVRDFLSFRIFGYDFAIFNIADACLVIGTVLILFFMMKEDTNGKNSNKRRSKSKTR